MADDAVGRPAPAQPADRVASVRDAISACFGAFLGLAPHVLHHIGLIAGAAFVTGVGGNAVFFLVGLLFSAPLLRRLYRRFHTWRAPVVAVAVFAAAFSLSAFVIGPAVTGGSGTDDGPQPVRTPQGDHSSHHSRQ